MRSYFSLNDDSEAKREARGPIREGLSRRSWPSSCKAAALLMVSISFSASGESQASKVTRLPGFNENCLSGEGSDNNRNDHDNAVAVSQQEADKASRKKPSRH